MASIPDDDFYVSPQTIDNLQGDGTVWQIDSVSLDNGNLPDGTLSDIVVITFHLVGYPGSFVQLEPFTDLWDGFAALDIFPRVEQYQAIWALTV